jgi:Flp pilus assembly protein CpaB
MRDLRGVEMGRSFTDSAGQFVIPSSAQPGQYIVVAARQSQIKDTQVTLVLNDVEVKIALPDAGQDATRNVSRHVVSAATLGIPEKARRHLQLAQKEFSKGISLRRPTNLTVRYIWIRSLPRHFRCVHS